MEMKELSEMVAVALNGIVEKEVEKQSTNSNIEYMETDKLLALLNDIETYRHDVLDHFVKELNYVDMDNLDADDVPDSVKDTIIDEGIDDYLSCKSEKEWAELIDDNCDVREFVVTLVRNYL